MKKAKESRINRTQFKRLMKEKGWTIDKNVLLYVKDDRIIAIVVKKNELIPLSKNQKIVMDTLSKNSVICYKYTYSNKSFVKYE